MKKLLILLALMLVGAVVSAKQRVEYYRYNLSWNVASDAKTDKILFQKDLGLSVSALITVRNVCL